MKDDLSLFFDSVSEMSDDYERMVAKLRAAGKFKSTFGAHARGTTTMTNAILSEKERREFPADFYKTILRMAQERRKPAGLTAAISDLLGKKNPGLEIPHDRTILVPLEALVSRKTSLTGRHPSESKRSLRAKLLGVEL